MHFYLHGYCGCRPHDIEALIIFILGLVFVLVTTLVYIRIYLAVRRHKNQIQALQVQHAAQSDEMANFASLVKSAFGVFYVYLLFVDRYCPHFISLAIFKIKGPSATLKKKFLVSLTFVFLNSSLNPAIYCLKIRHIRHVIMDILQNICWHSNRASC